MSDIEDEKNKGFIEDEPVPTADFTGPLKGPGSRIGRFSIERELGRGGMGVVYLARDTRLDRSVAIKSLPPEVVNNTQIKSRLKREAKLLASLNHPNIATIYEELEEEQGAGYLILEYIPGQTLADRLATGPMPVQEVLSVFRQIAEALEAAHREGIVHRDLKPANIKITEEDRVKVLDFGVAKAVGGEALNKQSTATEPGKVIGTAAYMSPEQARGKQIDKRTDIWAYGCCLYESLTGIIPFEGPTASDTLARILEHEPDWEVLPQAVPASIRILLRRCLEKDPHQRLQHIGDARLEIADALSDRIESLSIPPPKRLSKMQQVMLWCFVIFIVAAGSFIVSTWIASRQEIETLPRNVTASVIDLPDNTSLFLSKGESISFSPDGKFLVYVAVAQDGIQRLYLREMAADTTTLIPGTEGASGPFFGPNGQNIAFFAEDKEKGQHELKVVRIGDGEPLKPEALCRVPPMPCGGTWESSDRIIYSPIHHHELFAISITNPEEQEIVSNIDVSLGEYGHTWPCMLPEGNGIIFTLSKGDPLSGLTTVVKWKGQNRAQELLANSSFARYVSTGSTGYLVFLSNESLWAVRFDPKNTTNPIKGEPFPVENRIGSTQYNGGQFAISNDGTFVFASGTSPLGLTRSKLVWVNAQGMEEEIGAKPQYYDTWSEPRLSPDGRQVAVKVSNYTNLLLCDLDKNEFSKLTNMKGYQFGPLWHTKNGQRYIIFGNQDPKVPPNLYSQPVNRSEEAALLYESQHAVHATSISERHNIVLLRMHYVHSPKPAGTSDIWLYGLGGEPNEPWFETEEYNESAGEFSPDGLWIAYTSNEEGQNEVYIGRYPSGDRRKVSSDGGSEPAWGRNKDKLELFYRDGKSFMRVEVTQTEPELKTSKPEQLFADKYLRVEYPDSRNYDISEDGKFLVIKPVEEQTAPVTQLKMVNNWFDKLRQNEKSIKD